MEEASQDLRVNFEWSPKNVLALIEEVQGRQFLYDMSLDEYHQVEKKNAACYIRMSPQTFDDLLRRVGPLIQKRSKRESVTPEERLLLCLRYLATGESFRSLHFTYCLGETTVGNIVHDTCVALVEVLKPEFMRTPSTAAEWNAIADQFWTRWNLPNTLGAIDGKHVHIRRPANSGSLWRNYKYGFSSLIVAVSDADKKIIYLSTGSYGHEGDAGIYGRSDLADMLSNPANPLDLPAPSNLPGTNVTSPYFLVGDAAFPLKTYMMKPFPGDNLSVEQRIYNYRLSRGRRIVESLFGVLAARFRILLKSIEAWEQNIDPIIESVCCLHNYLLAMGDSTNPLQNGERPEDLQMEDVVAVGNPMARNAPNDAKIVRTNLMHFFNGPGAVEWQNQML